MIANYEPCRCREIVQDTIPPIGSATAIVYLDRGRTYMIPGGKRCQRDALYLLRVAIPAVKEGECKLLITWDDEWRSDIYEVTQETAEIYEGFLWATCQQRGWL